LRRDEMEAEEGGVVHRVEAGEGGVHEVEAEEGCMGWRLRRGSA
jgi:hypothetical protein